MLTDEQLDAFEFSIRNPSDEWQMVKRVIAQARLANRYRRELEERDELLANYATHDPECHEAALKAVDERREMRCTCGYDEKIAPLMIERDARLEETGVCVMLNEYNSDFGMSASQLHAGIAKLWKALDKTGVQQSDVFTMAAEAINRCRRDHEAMEVLRERGIDLCSTGYRKWEAGGECQSDDPANALLAWKAKYGKQETCDDA